MVARKITIRTLRAFLISMREMYLKFDAFVKMLVTPGYLRAAQINIEAHVWAMDCHAGLDIS
jgi:hypothetical protein